jgi:hypothetical protein
VYTRRGRTAAVATVAVAAAVALPLLVVKGSRTIANSRAGRTATSLAPPSGSVPNTPAALLVGVDANNEVVGLTLLALAPSGSGGAVVVVPAGTEWFTAGSNRAARLASAYDDGGGLDAERDAVEGVLGITTSVTEAVDQSQLAAMLAPYAPLRVVFDDRVLGTNAAGQEEVLYPAGPVDLTAAQAARVLIDRGPNESEITRLPRVASIWSAVLSSGARTASTMTRAAATSTSAGPSTPTPATTVLTPATVADQLAAVARGSAAVRLLPVRPVLDAVANPDGLDLLAPDNAGQKLLMAELLPGAISPANANIRFRVVNESGDPDLLYEAVGRLAYVGANVVVVSQPEATQAATVIEYQSTDRKTEASRYLPVIGPATVRESEERIVGIDATVILGQDFATFMQTERARGTTTSTAAAFPTTTTTIQEKP